MASVRLPKVFMGAQNHSLPDTKADAVLKHMIGTAGVKSVRYYQGQYVPDSTENIVVAPGINACVQDIQETKDRELQKLVVNLTGAGPHITARHLTDFVESCDRDFHLDMQNKLGNTTYVFEQVAVNSSAAYRGLPGMPKIKTSKSRSAMPYVQFTKTPFTTNRTLDNVFFEQRQVLRQRLTFFQEHRVRIAATRTVSSAVEQLIAGRLVASSSLVPSFPFAGTTLFACGFRFCSLLRCLVQDWYDKKGQPYMLGLLLHGSPGTGKTSLIKAIANMTGRHIISVSLEAIHTKRQLKHLFQNEDVHVAQADGTGQPEIFRIPINRRLFVLEDIDAASQLVLDRQYQKPAAQAPKLQTGPPKTREEWQRHYAGAGDAEEEDDEEDDDAINLATLLNILDGSECLQPTPCTSMCTLRPCAVFHCRHRPGYGRPCQLPGKPLQGKGTPPLCCLQGRTVQ